jgi:GntR family transcriptional repressor for pyruvate dehydrogenase complex
MADESWTPVPRQTVLRIQQMILDGRLEAGARLPSQRALAERLEVSRASLREALSALETLGLLRIEPGRGTFVKKSGEGPAAAGALWRFAERYRLEEVYQLRYALESFIAGQAARSVDAGQLDDLAAVWQEMRAAVARLDLVSAADCDFRFHQILLSCCGNAMLAEIMHGIRQALFASQSLPFARHASSEEPVAEHQAILEALRRRDEAAATRAMQDHIRGAARRAGIRLES